MLVKFILIIEYDRTVFGIHHPSVLFKIVCAIYTTPFLYNYLYAQFSFGVRNQRYIFAVLDVVDVIDQFLNISFIGRCELNTFVFRWSFFHHYYRWFDDDGHNIWRYVYRYGYCHQYEHCTHFFFGEFSHSIFLLFYITIGTTSLINIYRLFENIKPIFKYIY